MPTDYYLTQGRLESLLDLPVSLPLTSLAANEWLIIATLQLNTPQAFTLQFLQMSLSSVYNNDLSVDSLTAGSTSASGVYVFPGVPTYVTPGMGLAFIGLYPSFSSLTSPATQAAGEAPTLLLNTTNTLPVSVARVATPATYASPGPYSIVACNNTSNCVLRLSVLGQLRLDLGLL